MLRGALMVRGEPDVRVTTAIAMQSVAEPFIRLRADRHLRRGRIVLPAGGTGQPYATADYAAVQRSLELSADALLVAKHGVDGVYDSDPKTHPNAKSYARLTYREAIERRVKVTDPLLSCWPRSRTWSGTSSTWRQRAPCRRSARGVTSAPGSPLPDVRRRPAGFLRTSVRARRCTGRFGTSRSGQGG
ncbi:amino acid kinase family protein [Streptomyces sp. NPDC054833]